MQRGYKRDGAERRTSDSFMGYLPLVIPDVIKEKLKAEVKIESDPESKAQFQEIIDCF